MSSTISKRWRYVKDRCVNAYWMLRGGKFKLIIKSINIELAHRVGLLRSFLSGPAPTTIAHATCGLAAEEGAEVPGSAFIDRRRVVPPSYRPTVAQPPLALALRANPEVIARDLREILSKLAIEEGARS